MVTSIQQAAPCPDEARLAAFVEDPRGVQDRAELVAHFASCAQCRDVVRHAHEVRESLEAESGRAQSRPGRWIAAAAACVLVVAGAAYWRATGSGPEAESDLVRPLLGNRTAVERLWSGGAFRGSSRSEDLEARSFSFGVVLVDLRLALAVGNRDASRQRLTLLASWMQDLEFMEEETAFLAQAAERSHDATALARIGEELDAHANSWNSRLDPVLLSLGRWAEAARLAAIVQDPAFFASARNRRVPDWWRTKLGDRLPTDVDQLLARIERDWTSKAGKPDHLALESALAALISRYGRAP
jgi:hypothetical protein